MTGQLELTGADVALAPGLVRPTSAPTEAPALDAAQQQVVDHRGGPLLVLAGPGTGKTTTLVEAAVDRVERDGLAPEQILLLTFSRRAANDLRARISARLNRTTRGSVAMTFHSYAYALVRRELSIPIGATLRLLSGAEQDIEVRRLLEGDIEDGGFAWPEELRAALPLRGFRSELRDLLLRAQERGYDHTMLRAMGERLGRPAWVAAGDFLSRYDARFDVDATQEVLDYASLVRTAGALLSTDDELRARERGERRVVFVDELQDTDPAQLDLLWQLAGDGGELVAVGDPDQSIYAFRGADAHATREFRARFLDRDGKDSALVRLTTCRRFGRTLVDASRSVAAGLPFVGAVGGEHRKLTSSVAGDGEVSVRLAASASAEAGIVADVLRRAHLRDGVPWSDMAVIVRSATRSAASLRRGLLASGVPVAAPRDEVPLAQEPLVAGLLVLVRAALQPASIDEDVAGELLTGPVVRGDAMRVRKLARALRQLELGTGGTRTSKELVLAAVLDPAIATGVHDFAARPLDRLTRLLEVARNASKRGTAEDVLWAVWESSGRAHRLEEESRGGGARGALADRSLDAVIALFDAAARYVDRLPAESTIGFLDDIAAQEIPGETMSQRAPEGDAVALVTAHGSKGLEWRVVVVAGVQDGVWPDLRTRATLLRSEDLPEARDADPGRPSGAASDPVSGAVSDVAVDVEASVRRATALADERRLFYVAVTRAREQLVVTAVAGQADGDQPSRFLAELGVAVPATPGAVPRPLTMAGLVGELRRVAAHDDDPALRRQAAARLARLAASGDADVAHPDRWWGTQALSDDRALALPGEPVAVTPSRVESFDTCGLRWFLETAVGVTGESGPPQVMGSLVHALAEIAAGDPTISREELIDRLEAALPRLELGAPWAVRRRRADAVQWLVRFLDWHASNPRELLGVEEPFSVELGDGALLTGRVDRIEKDEEGRGVVIDLKTSGSKPAADEVHRHAQLGAYQLAVALGGFLEKFGLKEPGGASLLQLRRANKDGAHEQQQRALADDPDDPDWARALVLRVVEGMGGASFAATPNDLCRMCKVATSCPTQPKGRGLLP